MDADFCHYCRKATCVCPGESIGADQRSFDKGYWHCMNQAITTYECEAGKPWNFDGSEIGIGQVMRAFAHLRIIAGHNFDDSATNDICKYCDGRIFLTSDPVLEVEAWYHNGGSGMECPDGKNVAYPKNDFKEKSPLARVVELQREKAEVCRIVDRKDDEIKRLKARIIELENRAARKFMDDEIKRFEQTIGPKL